jgi:hypothetical protein
VPAKTTEPAPLPDTPDLHGAFPRLSDRQIESLARHGERDGPARARSSSGKGTRPVPVERLRRLVSGRTVVIATGARYRRLPVPRLEKLEGVSVYYAASWMEAQLCRGDPVAVVGGGNSAGQATLFLAQHTPKVLLLVREDELAEHMSRYLVDRIERTPNVEVLIHTEVRELVGDRALEALVVEDDRTGERRRLEARARFVFIGADPHTRWLGPARDDPAGRASPPATRGRDRSSGWPRPSGRAPCRSSWCTDTWRRSAARPATTRGEASRPRPRSDRM